ncbi:Negative regulator of genetic competence [Syntrophobotulus glycolicus DSM 8271]|uniref:Negative regulator of genetic competence n=1 Tax=Syntrophobotulus glycolicus (strain DSM 8271 / FlGlyR) TaxID=645991 RepID=F0SZX7_SYNGF|nr:adaptor protein MecA [Syntrophobotulus glycolicus]ADY54988.1 Negative regulator of genetic competence [Syntrophobotulus glycolicus DSM 8271]
MRILKVNENTVRIFISFSELSARNISLADFFQRSERTEQFFWEIIGKAREEVNFNLDQPFWIQATVASDDEFVITVIKQDEQIEAEINHIIQNNFNDKKSTPKVSVKTANSDWVYVFSDFEDVLNCLSLIPDVPQLSSALYKYEQEYFLSLGKMTSSRKRKIMEAILDEYGEAILLSDIFLKEHGETIISENAISKLKKIVEDKTVI